MLYSNALNITVLLCLYVPPNTNNKLSLCHCLGDFGKEARKMLLFVPLYIAVCPSSCNSWGNAEPIIMNLEISDIYCNPLTHNNTIYNLVTTADTLHENLHAFCWLLKTNFSIFGETKASKQQLQQNFMVYFKPLRLCKLVLDPCLLK
jgi:hypothetical protein